MGGWADGAVVPILCYHAVDDDEIDLTISPRRFEQHMDWLARAATPIDLTALARLLLGEVSVRRPVVVTFDDGYASVFDAAFPVLQRLGIPFGVFVTTGFVNGEQTLRGHSKPLVSWHQLRSMLDSKLLTVGCHTHSHETEMPPDPDVFGKDVEEALATLHDHLGVQARTFAFPKGRYDAATLMKVRPWFDLTFAGDGLQVAAPSNGQPLRRIGITKDFSRSRLQAAFSPHYWKARDLRSRRFARSRPQDPT
jgi:peptidoglycan/xylan/chitin deacetylase (PgdA/CDA1 family)